MPGHKYTRSRSTQHSTEQLIKKLAHRSRARFHVVWSLEDIVVALRALFRDPQATFRSPGQQQMLEAVASRSPEVVIILKTGSGKSLAFMIPAMLR